MSNSSSIGATDKTFSMQLVSYNNENLEIMTTQSVSMKVLF